MGKTSKPVNGMLCKGGLDGQDAKNFTKRKFDNHSLCGEKYYSLPILESTKSSNSNTFSSARWVAIFLCKVTSLFESLQSQEMKCSAIQMEAFYTFPITDANERVCKIIVFSPAPQY